MLTLLVSVAMVAAEEVTTEEEAEEPDYSIYEGGEEEYEIDKKEKDKEMKLEGGGIPDNEVVLEDDIIDHECANIKYLTLPRNKQNDKDLPPLLKRLKGVPHRYVKWTHAYGIPILGIDTFTETSMKKACYLVRYLFADNEWLRRYAYARGMMAVGYKGGVCCPGQIGNKGMSCPCISSYPFTGQGAPSHELAHYFIKYVLAKIPADKLTMPKFIDDTTWQHKESPMGEGLSGFLWNAYWQDKYNGFTKIKQKDNGTPKTHHYFIYSGMQSYINTAAGSGELRAHKRNILKTNQPNLYAIMKLVWPCNNAYISPCKDAAYGFTLGLNQKFKIGKADPNDPSKMICKDDLDFSEVATPNVISPIAIADAPAGPHIKTKKIQPPQCEKALSKLRLTTGVCDAEKKPRYCRKKKVKQAENGVEVVQYGDVMKSLKLDGADPDDHGNEYAWWLRKCCATTAKMNQPAVEETGAVEAGAGEAGVGEAGAGEAGAGEAGTNAEEFDSDNADEPSMAFYSEKYDTLDDVLNEYFN